MLNLIKNLNIWLKKPIRFDYLNKYIKRNSRILDIGCGDFPVITKKYFPLCQYYGVDKNIPRYGFENMNKFYQIDLNKKGLSEIPNNYFDVIIMSHIIEHLENGKYIVKKLVKKLRNDGIIYIETPSPLSINFPSMKGTLNFYDDKTHVRVYSIQELTTILTDNNLTVLSKGTRRSFKRILFFPIYSLGAILKWRFLPASVFYDLVGFANYIIAKKIELFR